jgi:hypothetical protein
MTTWFPPDEPPPSAEPPLADPLCVTAVVVAALAVVVAEFVVPTLATDADFSPPHADVSSARAASALRVDKQYGLDPGIASIEARLSETNLKPLETVVPRRRRVGGRVCFEVIDDYDEGREWDVDVDEVRRHRLTFRAFRPTVSEAVGRKFLQNGGGAYRDRTGDLRLAKRARGRISTRVSHNQAKNAPLDTARNRPIRCACGARLAHTARPMPAHQYQARAWADRKASGLADRGCSDGAVYRRCVA